MKITRGVDPFFSFVLSEGRRNSPENCSRDFYLGYDTFLDWSYVPFFAQDIQNSDKNPEGESTFIDYSKVSEETHQSVTDAIPELRIHNLKEFWEGYFAAEEIVKNIFFLTYTKVFEAA
jgi:hypothetical protein